MSRATVSTGPINLQDEQRRTASGGLPCHVLILADFSGRAHRGLDDSASLASRTIQEANRDNFEELFTRLQVTLQLPLAEQPIHFGEFDDLHPDFIHERVDLFDQLRSLKRRLNNPATFASAAAQISTTATSTGAIPAASPTPADDLLDSLLQSSAARNASQGIGDVQALIRQIAAPYVIPRADPQLEELLAAVDESTAQLMRKILHSSAFQILEASWRGLHLLVRRLETDHNLKLFIADISLGEILTDTASQQNPQGQLHKLLTQHSGRAGAVPFSLILGDYRFTDQAPHASALTQLGSLAQQLGALFIGGGSERLAGCNALHQQPDPADWSPPSDTESAQGWQGLRANAASQHVVLVAPRFLARLPYGKRTSPVASFGFDELPGHNPHDFYVWSNGGWLLTLLLAETWARNGSISLPPAAEIGDLPLHVHQADGEIAVTACAETFLTDAAATALQHAGLMVLRSVLNQDCVRISGYRSLHESGRLPF